MAVRGSDGFGVDADVDRMVCPWCSVDVLANAPQNTRWIVETEVAHAPGLIFQRCHTDPVLLQHATCLDLLPPRVHILDQDVHHEILGKRFGAEILEQETDLAKMKVGDAATFRGHRESKIFVKLFGQLEVFGWNECFDFSDFEV